MIRTFSKQRSSANTIRFYWLLLFILINAVAAFWIIESGELVGDLEGRPYSNTNVVMLAAVFIILSYYLILSPIYDFVDKIKVKAISLSVSERLIADRMGLSILVLQVAFWIFNLYYGVNIAGAGNLKTDNKILSYFFIALDPDFLFFIYYGLYREHKYFYPNLGIFCASNLMRGWAGILIFIIFFEGCRSYRLRTLNFKKILVIALVTIVAYPVLASFKWVIRAAAFSGVDYGAIADQTLNSVEATDYSTLVRLGVEHAIGRLQVVSQLVEVIENGSSLQNDFYDFKFLPFWLDGLQGVVFDRMFYGAERNSVGVVMAQYISPSFEGVGNTNLSYASWFFILPMLSPLYVTYTLALGVLAVYFTKKIKNDGVASDLVWLVWLVYLMPPWLGAMVKYIYSALFFLIMQIALSKCPRLRLLSVKVCPSQSKTPQGLSRVASPQG